MPAFLLCVFLVCATTLTWAQVGSRQAEISPPTELQLLTPQAIQAVPADSSGWSAMDALEIAAANPDRSLAAPATERAAQIAHAIDTFDLDEKEIPKTELRDHRAAWLEIASKEGTWVDIRVYALDVAARLNALLELFDEPENPALWQPFLSASDPEMRAAAITLVPESAQLPEQLQAFLVGDEPEEVAISAARRLCGPLREELSGTPKLGPEELERLQILARTLSLPIVARTQLAPCLIVDGSLESRRTLAILLQRSPPALRRHLSNLIRLQSSAPQE